MRLEGFVGGSYTSLAPTADAERTVNLFPETLESPGAKARAALYPAPGFTAIHTPTPGAGRGLYTLNGQTFVVVGDALIELAITGFGPSITVAATVRATGLSNPDGGPVTMASNGDGGFQLLISAGSFGYCYDLRTRTLTQVLDDAAQVGFIDGFFLALSPGSSSFRISNPENGGTVDAWDASQIAQREDAADKWAAFLVVQKELWLFGSQTISVWYDAGLSPFPFAPNPSVFLQHAIAANASACVLAGAPIWLGQSLDGGAQVYRAAGYVVSRVSTHAMERAIRGYATVADAEAFVYQEDGHSFYVLTFPTAQATWVLDALTGLWTERGDWDGTRFTGLAVRGHVFTNGVHLTLDRATGVVYRMGADLATGADGKGLRRLRAAPHVSGAGSGRLNQIVYDRFQLDLETGIGLTTGQGADPQVFLRYSDDGGHTWSAPIAASAGLRGSYRTRAIWWRLGAARDRVFEVSMSDPVPWRILDAFLDLRGGTS